jgi:hypothetical protein
MKKILNLLYNYLVILIAVALFFGVVFGLSYLLADTTNFDGEESMGWLLLLIVSTIGIFIFSFFYLIFIYFFSTWEKEILYNKKFLFGFVLFSFPLSFFLSLQVFESILGQYGNINLFFCIAIFNAFIFFLETMFYVYFYKKYFKKILLTSCKWRGHS